jgi:trimeric autotransporter adhesin
VRRPLVLLWLIWTVSFCAHGQPYVIKTAVGGGPPDNFAATPGGGQFGVALSGAGDVYFVASNNTRVWRLEAATGLLVHVAGNGIAGYGGDGGPATSAQFVAAGIAVDSAGNLYIADAANGRIRKVSGGIITTVAGNGTPGFNGDGVAALNAQLNAPVAVALDSAGTLHFVDANNNRVRKISNGLVTTVAGTGIASFGGDNGPATSASMNPGAIAFDSSGTLYIADSGNNRIRRVRNGIITTVAGTGGGSPYGNFGGDEGPATNAQLAQPRGIAFDSAGNLYIADTGNHRIREVSNGIITTVAGAGSGNSPVGAFGGDNFPAVNAQLNAPSAIAADSSGNLYIADGNNNRVRKVAGGVITTLVGGASSGDNGPATNTRLLQPTGVAVDSAGSLYVVDTQNRTVRRVTNGVISTVAGGGSLTDNFVAIGAGLSGPLGIALDSSGNLYIAESLANRVRKVSNGIITTVAGNGTAGFSGDGGAAADGQLNFPSAVAVDSAGNVYIADTNNNRIRKVSNGVITTIAGTGTPGSQGDGGPAVNGQLNFPTGIAADSAGNLYITDGNRIRRISAGVISTVVGTGTPGFSGDGGPATRAQLNGPNGIAVDAGGNLFVADVANRRIRQVSNGTINTVAGNGSIGNPGDGSPAATSPLELGPELVASGQFFLGVAADAAGNVYLAQPASVRMLVPSGVSCPSSVRPSALQANAAGGALLVTIQTLAACPWNIGALPSWLTLAGATSSDSGLVIVTLFAAPNPGAARSALIFAGMAPIAVTQSGGGSPAAVNAIANSATNRAGAVAPGEIVVLYGSGLGPQQLTVFQADAAGIVSSSLAGTQVFFNGIPAPIIYTSSTQLSVVVPYGVTGGGAQLNVSNTTTQAFASGYVAVTAASPGIFTADSSGIGQAAALNQDNSLNSAAKPARPGDIVSLFVTGEGQVFPAGVDGKLAAPPLPRPFLPVGVTIGGKPADVKYAGGAPGLVAGVMQINAQIPTSISQAGAVPVVVQIGGVSSQTEVTLAIAAK